MAVHEFGILDRIPREGERFEAYTPEKYGCIACEDERIESMAEDLKRLCAFSHSTDKPCMGLEYAGITLIPSASLNEFIAITAGVPGAEALNMLLKKARQEGKWVIHYGL